MDAVFSIMQMPPGVPVATVAIDGAKNAAILAAKILAASDEELLNKLKAYTAEQKEAVKAMTLKLLNDKYGIEEEDSSQQSLRSYRPEKHVSLVWMPA